MTRITIEGNVCNDVDLRFTPGGDACANFSVAVNHRKKQGNDWVDDGATFYRIAAWKVLGENVAASIEKGMSVIVTGDVRMREYTTREGVKGQSLDVTADTVGPSLRWQTAKVERAGRQAGGSGQGAGWGSQQQGQRGQQAVDPWATAQSDQPPF